MRASTRVIHDIEALSAHRGAALVPTMGALHDGHAALIRRAAELGPPVIVSVFVNPTQFDERADLERYPRTLDADVAAAEHAGAAIVFAPDVDTMYPPGAPVPMPELPPVATTPGLEDVCRPGHLAGVAQVVARLFDVVRPRYAVFGEKDYQQLLLIEALARRERERWDGLEIVRGATVREPDGLALSSRNALLDEESRMRALGLYRALQIAHAAQRPATAEMMMQETLATHGLRIEYAVVRDAKNLLPVSGLDRPTRGLIAARLGDVRLIDNMPMTVWR